MSLLPRLALQRRHFVLAMAALAVGALGITALFEWQERGQEFARRFNEAGLHARALEDHLTQSFNG